MGFVQKQNEVLVLPFAFPHTQKMAPHLHFHQASLMEAEATQLVQAGLALGTHVDVQRWNRKWND